MNAANGVGPGERQQIIVAFDVGVVVGQQFAAKILFRQAELLDRGTHGAVEHDNARACRRFQLLRPHLAFAHGTASGSAVAARLPSAWQIARVSSARLSV